MDKVINSEFLYHILVITDISGENQLFTITFKTKDKEMYKLVFDNVYDLRYSVENANIDRFAEIENRDNVTSSICIFENSSYIEAYRDTSLEFTYGIVDKLMHYVITDFTDTVVDILTTRKPKLEKIENEETIETLKSELEELRAWKADQDDKDKKEYGEDKR